MRAYLELSRKTFMQSAAYPFEFWGQVVGHLVYYVMWISIWYALYQGPARDLPGTMRETLTYVALGQFLQAVGGAGQAAWQIADRIRSGDIALELVKPVDFLARFFFADLGYVVFRAATVLVPLYGFLIWLLDPVLPATAATWLGFAVSAVLGFLIQRMLDLLIALLAFWLIETAGIADFIRVASELLSGLLIPFWFFPEALRTVARWLPFQAMFYLPNAIFVGRIGAADLAPTLALQAFWVLVMFCVLRLAWGGAVRKLVVQGG